MKEPARVVNFATILPIAKPTSLGLVASREREVGIRLTRGSRKTPVKLQFAKPTIGRPARLAPMKSNRFSVQRASGNISNIYGANALETIGLADIDLPPGMPRFVNAATLKRMLKAHDSDVLLKQVRGRWEICDDFLRVDLLDDSVEFRLGAIQIWS